MVGDNSISTPPECPPSSAKQLNWMVDFSVFGAFFLSFLDFRSMQNRFDGTIGRIRLADSWR